jgi:predicted small secreted protein
MSERNKSRIVCVSIGVFLFFLLMAMSGCGTLAGIGRDLTAWAEGGAMDAGDNARAIRGK